MNKLDALATAIKQKINLPIPTAPTDKLGAIKMVEGLNIPAPLKAMASLAIMGMDDQKIGSIFETATDAVKNLQAGDRTTAQKLLVSMGLPEEFAGQLLDKVVANDANPTPNG